MFSAFRLKGGVSKCKSICVEGKTIGFARGSVQKRKINYIDRSHTLSTPRLERRASEQLFIVLRAEQQWQTCVSFK